mmetsp:Transcript_74695/g.131924  ORF Transcript_74695/g.131924 Transcript_74695/m.131924 type:complete len:236 (-) Transcript_74695:59-766(-)
MTHDALHVLSPNDHQGRAIEGGLVCVVGHDDLPLMEQLRERPHQRVLGHHHRHLLLLGLLQNSIDSRCTHLLKLWDRVPRHDAVDRGGVEAVAEDDGHAILEGLQHGHYLPTQFPAELIQLHCRECPEDPLRGEALLVRDIPATVDGIFSGAVVAFHQHPGPQGLLLAVRADVRKDIENLLGICVLVVRNPYNVRLMPSRGVRQHMVPFWAVRQQPLRRTEKPTGSGLPVRRGLA